MEYLRTTTWKYVVDGCLGGCECGCFEKVRVTLWNELLLRPKSQASQVPGCQVSFSRLLVMVAQNQALKILMPADRPAFCNALSSVASGAFCRTATSRYAASYAERPYSLARGRTLLTVSATVCDCSTIVRPPSSSTNRRTSGCLTRLRRSATNTAFVISTAHTAGTTTVLPASATSTPSAYSLASSGKNQASVTEASTTIPVKIAVLA